MSRTAIWYASVFLSAAAACFAQSREPSDAWLMQNYRFAAPPAPSEVQPVSPAVAQLQEIQNTTLSILRKADFAGDFEAALAAAAQATATAQLIGAVTGQLRPPQPPPPPPGMQQQTPREPEPPKPAALAPGSLGATLVAFQDRTIQPAAKLWTDGPMLHYLTPQGAHGQVRLDFVDWKRSAALNRKSLSGLPARTAP